MEDKMILTLVYQKTRRHPRLAVCPSSVRASRDVTLARAGNHCRHTRQRSYGTISGAQHATPSR